MALGGWANSFPQKAKIKKSQDFLTVLKARGKGVVRLSGQWFELKAVLTQGKVSSRFGLTVGKHFSKRSVDRNLVKRILREAIRHSVLTHPAESPSALQSRTFVLRLKKKVPVPAEGACLNSLKKELSEDANRLLSQLEARIQVLDQGKKSLSFHDQGLPVSFFALGWPQLSVSSYLFSIFLYIHTAIRCPPRSLAHVFPNSPLQSLRGKRN